MKKFYKLTRASLRFRGSSKPFFILSVKSKEKLISSLKEGSGLDVGDGGGAVALEMEELRHEKELQREEIQKLQGQVGTLRAEIQASSWIWQQERLTNHGTLWLMHVGSV